MITEDYCSFEVAKLLKEKEFDGEIHTTFDEEGYTRPSITHQMAMKWLRKVYNLFICIEFDAPTFVADIYKMNEIDEHGCAKHIQPTIANCKTYEEAVEATLKYALENLIQRKIK